MKQTSIAAFAALILLSTTSLISISAFAQTKSAQKTAAETKTTKATKSSMAKKVTPVIQKFTVKVDGTYSPSNINVKAGKPVEITFTKGEDVGCGGTVVFSSLGITKELKTDKTVVAFTPKKAGTIAFSCPMGMYKGSVTVK